jgi:hypothetical protein
VSSPETPSDAVLAQPQNDCMNVYNNSIAASIHALRCPGAPIASMGVSIAALRPYCTVLLDLYTVRLSCKNQLEYPQLLLCFSGVIGSWCVNPMAMVSRMARLQGLSLHSTVQPMVPQLPSCTHLLVSHGSINSMAGCACLKRA